jgi:hypothetical protein
MEGEHAAAVGGLGCREEGRRPPRLEGLVAGRKGSRLPRLEGSVARQKGTRLPWLEGLVAASGRGADHRGRKGLGRCSRRGWSPLGRGEG